MSQLKNRETKISFLKKFIDKIFQLKNRKTKIVDL